MRVRPATWIAIVLGSTLGALAALLGTKPDLKRAQNPVPSLRPITEISRAAFSVAQSAGTAPPAPSVTEAKAEASDSGADSRSSFTPLTSAKELLIAELKCDQGAADQCMQAAVSHAVGTAGSANPTQAERFRRRARTYYVADCDKGESNACLTLVRMYRSGDGVEPNPRLVEAFEKRLRGLCALRASAACSELTSSQSNP